MRQGKKRLTVAAERPLIWDWVITSRLDMNTETRTMRKMTAIAGTVPENAVVKDSIMGEHRERLPIFAAQFSWRRIIRPFLQNRKGGESRPSTRPPARPVTSNQ